MSLSFFFSFLISLFGGLQQQSDRGPGLRLPLRRSRGQHNAALTDRLEQRHHAPVITCPGQTLGQLLTLCLLYTLFTWLSISVILFF